MNLVGTFQQHLSESVLNTIWSFICKTRLDMTKENTLYLSDLNDKEDILGGVSDGEYSRACQCGDGRCLNVWTQHPLRLLRV